MERSYPTYCILKHMKIEVCNLVLVHEKKDRTMKQNRSPEIEVTTNANIKMLCQIYGER